jgi:hypothetical protein
MNNFSDTVFRTGTTFSTHFYEAPFGTNRVGWGALVWAVLKAELKRKMLLRSY